MCLDVVFFVCFFWLECLLLFVVFVFGVVRVFLSRGGEVFVVLLLWPKCFCCGSRVCVCVCVCVSVCGCLTLQQLDDVAELVVVACC